MQIAAAVAFLHANNVLHRDVKSANVFLQRDGLVRLGDFGMCRHLRHASERPRTTAGVLQFAACDTLQVKHLLKQTEECSCILSNCSDVFSWPRTDASHV